MEHRDHNVGQPAANHDASGKSDAKHDHHDHHHHDHHDHIIHIKVDGEPVETTQRKMTPNEIIREFGNGQDTATHYLVEIKGSHNKSFQGKGDEKIELHEGMQFQIISTGPTPVSEGPIRTGVSLFIEGLQKLGFEPVALPEKPDHIVIEYTVPTGRFAGKHVRHGFVVPPDFPITPPTGPHVSPHIHPIKPDGQHPTGAVHESQAQAFQQALGGQWQYWSRPFPEWARSKKTVAVYMSHVWRLWDSQ